MIGWEEDGFHNSRVLLIDELLRRVPSPLNSGFRRRRPTGTARFGTVIETDGALHG